MQNLNALQVKVRDDNDGGLEDFGVSKSKAAVEVYFRNIESHLIRHIEAADIVVGCVAWLTNPVVLNALRKKRGVSIIVQKEDWLRPDIHAERNWRMRQRSRYDAIPSLLSRLDKAVRGTVLGEMSYCGDPSIEAVRCVGNHNSERAPAFPRMHHKFIVLCKEISNEDDWKNYQPYEVWTGSFNFTKNAGLSLENAIVVKDSVIAEAYFKEWAQVAALSEKLNWRSDWVEPQWRVGS